MKNSTFVHLTDTNRVQIETLLNEGLKQTEIAKRIGVNRSTISREIRNRGTPSGYHAKIAQINYRKKRSICRPKRIIEETKVGPYVIEKIRSGWSPEVISGRLKQEIERRLRPKEEYVNPESIYQFVYQSEYGRQNRLYEYLRRGKTRRTREFGRKSQRETIPNRIFIDQRPKEVEQRDTIGHWETDTVHYPDKRGINTLVERKTRYAIFSKMERRTAEETLKVITKSLRNHQRKSLTLDNGKENTCHQAITKTLDLPVYFCHAYHSWEKGTNENMNGLLRRYLPRRTNLDTITQEDLNDIAFELNNRPRKILGYFTPQEVLAREYIKLNYCCI